MKIVTLKAENVKRLRAVEITPDGDVVVIAGRNAQGKSSVLDSIWMALAGAAGAKETQRPIRDGEREASVELDLGDLKVRRHWTEKGTTLSVAAADGAKYPSPQSVLDGLIGRLAFDPLAFAEASQKEQLATLLSVVELPFDPEKVAMERQGVFDQRTDVNREVKRLDGALSELEPTPEGTPDEEVDTAALAEELAAGEREATEWQAFKATVAEQELRLQSLREQVASLEDWMRDAKERMATWAGRDMEALRARLAESGAINANVRAKKERTALTDSLAVARRNAETLTAKLVEIDAKKEKALQSASMPLAGLSFDDEGVLFNDIPLSQVSDSERLRVSIAIAMALNPKIRVIRITDGSLLDSTNMALISEMAAEHDFQVWIERVDESGEVGITIEDGAVA